jgi:hypothetical protein
MLADEPDPSPSPTTTPIIPRPCTGDCSGNRHVAVEELVKGISMVVGNAPAGECTAFDASSDGAVTIDEVLAAVNAALFGCSDAGAVGVSGSAGP